MIVAATVLVTVSITATPRIATVRHVGACLCLSLVQCATQTTKDQEQQECWGEKVLFDVLSKWECHVKSFGERASCILRIEGAIAGFKDFYCRNFKTRETYERRSALRPLVVEVAGHCT